MKKLLLLSAAVLTGLTACTKNEVIQTPDQQITFSAPVVGAVTKAVPGEIGTNYDKAESFKVFGWYCTEDAFNPANSTVYMNNIKCVYNADMNVPKDEGDQGAWLPEHTYYWPKNGKLTFSAYSPSDVTGTVTANATTGLKISGFTTDADVAKQYDLLYSDRAYNKTTSIGETNSTYDGVDINFHHALSSIVVKVKTDMTYPDGTITVNSIQFENVYSKADFVENLTTGKEASSVDPSKWEGWQTPQTVKVGEKGVAVAYDAVQYGTTALLIPQTFAANTADSKGEIIMRVNYTIKNGDGTTIAQEAVFKLDSDNYTGNIGGQPVGIIDQWVKGYRYTYNLIFGVKQIYFAPSVDVWKDVVMDGVTI